MNAEKYLIGLLLTRYCRLFRAHLCCSLKYATSAGKDGNIVSKAVNFTIFRAVTIFLQWKPEKIHIQEAENINNVLNL